jgi:dsRNA-specific ribonuclease
MSPVLAPARTATHRDPITLLRALKRAGRIPNYRVTIDDARGPDHDKTFIASAQILARSGRCYTAHGEHRRHKRAMELAATAVLAELHAREPSHPLSLPPTKRQRRQIRERQAAAS